MNPQVGIMASYFALGFGFFYFVYAVKYYASGLIAFGVFNIGPSESEEATPAQRILAQEFMVYEGGNQYVSVQLPFFNELNVARRILEACLNIDCAGSTLSKVTLINEDTGVFSSSR